VNRLLLILMALTSSASAGTLCGTVRDATTQQPVAGAAVFLFDDQGASTGRNTGTAVDGTWCLDDVVAGTYTILVERDDYQVARVDGVVVEDTATDVTISAKIGIAFARAFPNPASDRVSLRWRVPDGVDFALEVFDLRGRRVKGWSGTGTGDDASLVWSLDGFGGQRLPTSTYFAVLRADGARRVQRIALLR